MVTHDLEPFARQLILKLPELFLMLAKLEPEVEHDSPQVVVVEPEWVDRHG